MRTGRSTHDWPKNVIQNADSSLLFEHIILWYCQHNANHQCQKAERSGAFWRPSEFALYLYFVRMKVIGNNTFDCTGFPFFIAGLNFVFFVAFSTISSKP